MEHDKEFRVKHKEDFYNIYDFLTKHHPGGKNYVQPYKDKDITNKMQHIRHSKKAYYLLEQYRINEVHSDRKHEVEDLETLVDWNKPMVGQVHHLGEKYNEWVNLPVDRKMRIFGNPVLELFTITPWYTIMIWIPISVGFILHGIQRYIDITKDSAPFLPIVLWLTLGVVLWTVLEYLMHRWIFHMEPSGKSMIMIYIHFFSHGIHHKIPLDPQRIIFPFLPAVLFAFVVFQIEALFTPKSIQILVFSGMLTGYVLYDLFHYYLHYCTPKEGTYAYNMKRYHNQHHFAHNNRGFGISTVFWDKIFSSMIMLKKLSMAIKW